MSSAVAAQPDVAPVVPSVPKGPDPADPPKRRRGRPRKVQAAGGNGKSESALWAEHDAALDALLQLRAKATVDRIVSAVGKGNLSSVNETVNGVALARQVFIDAAKHTQSRWGIERPVATPQPQS